MTKTNWFPKALALSFALGLFSLGAAFIFLGSLQVEHRFRVYGHAEARPGSPALFRVIATTDNPPGPLPEHHVEMRLLSKDGAQLLQVEARTNREGLAALSLATPADLSDGEYPVETTLKDPDGDVVEAYEFALHVQNEAPSFSSPQIKTTKGAEAHKLELFTAQGYGAPHLENLLYLRATKGDTGAPLVNTRVDLSLTYGTTLHPPPTFVTTDEWGLAQIAITPQTDCDWRATLHLGEESEDHTLTLTLNPRRALTAQVAKHDWGHGESIAFAVTPVHSGGPLYLDLFDGPAWIATGAELVGSARTPLRFTPKGLSPPTKPRIVTLSACFSPTSCPDAHIRFPLIWSEDHLSQKEIATIFMDALSERGVDEAYIQQLRPKLKQASSTRAVENLVRFLALRIPTEYQEHPLLLDSEALTGERLESVRDEMRWTLRLLFALLLIAGALAITGIGLQSARQRGRAMAEVLDELDELSDDSDEPPAQPHTLAVALQLIGLALTIVAFAGGVLLLLQQL